MRRSCFTVALLAGASLLSGCVAAVLPVAAGGMIARKAAGRDRAPSVAQPVTVPVAVAPMPGDPARMAAGTVYAGSLPAPPPVAAPASPDGETAPARIAGPTATAAGWPALVRFVAVTRTAFRHSALMTRGATVAEPRWVDCAKKPRAVLAPASLFVGPKGTASRIAEADLGWIVALPTMGTTLVVVADGPAAAADVRAAFAQAGLPRLIVGDTLLMAPNEAELPAVRAAAGARYCVVAVAGRRAADFPNALLPASTPPALADQWRAGWFLFGP